MRPRWHILFGVIFTILIWIAAPKINLLFLLLVFLSTFLIDFDHYLCFVLKTRKLGLFHSFSYHHEMIIQAKKDSAKGIREKGDFHIFHTIEFHLFVGLLSFFWAGFFYIFIGMVFHSLLDIASLLYDNFMYVREFSLIRWIWRRYTIYNQ